ncbi:hypothetical protein [Sphingobium fuliginis]|nr:hypothetical protein [Sphingobium fuliginis]
MFVAYSHLPPGGPRKFLSIGHTVGAGTGSAAAAWSYFGDSVPGHLAEERYTSIRERCLSAKVNKEDYEAAIARTSNPLAKMGIGRPTDEVAELYKLAENDCMSFAIDIANLLKPRGLKVPARGRTELPMAYIQRLIAANG